jgi:hypothetical protein
VTPRRVVWVVLRWVRLYTRGLPGATAARRVEEIDADLHDHIADGRARGVGERRLALEIASRMLRGLAADCAWRGRQAKRARSTSEEPMKTNPFRRPAVRVAVGVAAVLSLPLVAMQFSGKVVWSLADFVLAGVLLATIGAAVELALRKAGGLPAGVAIALLGVAAGVLGQADDAPGLVLLGMLLVGSGVALAARSTARGG